LGRFFAGFDCKFAGAVGILGIALLGKLICKAVLEFDLALRGDFVMPSSQTSIALSTCPCFQN
jgi:hypothetical protein